jgi:hypothetical protein
MPIMLINKIAQAPEGADLSVLGGFHDIPLKLLIAIICLHSPYIILMFPPASYHIDSAEVDHFHA